MYFEQFNDAANMAQQEKRLKEWKREWKIALIEKVNPEWIDLYDTITRYTGYRGQAAVRQRGVNLHKTCVDTYGLDHREIISSSFPPPMARP